MLDEDLKIKKKVCVVWREREKVETGDKGENGRRIDTKKWAHHSFAWHHA